MKKTFAHVSGQVEGLRERMSEASRRAQELFEALLSEAFGEY
jgi:hypothetical protein